MPAALEIVVAALRVPLAFAGRPGPRFLPPTAFALTLSTRAGLQGFFDHENSALLAKVECEFVGRIDADGPTGIQVVTALGGRDAAH